MTRVVRFHETGGPEVLSIVDEAVPEPSAGEVRIRVHAIGINRAEVMRRKGIHNEPVTHYPAGLGNEAAGLVEAVGDGVSTLAVGDRVSVIPSFSANQYGMYGEQVLAPASAVVKHPESLSWTDAASIWMMFLTAYSALIEDAKVGPGDVVLIGAASSSVGLAAIQLVNMAGGTPIALTRTNAKRDQLFDAGARHVIAIQEQDVGAEVKTLTDGKGATVVFDPVGGADFPKLVDTLTIGGTAYLYGALAEEVTPLPGIEFVANLQTVKGHNIWKTSGDAGRQKVGVEYILAGLASGQLHTVIDKVFTFDQIADSHRYVEANGQFGKVVVTV